MSRVTSRVDADRFIEPNDDECDPTGKRKKLYPNQAVNLFGSSTVCHCLLLIKYTQSRIVNPREQSTRYVEVPGATAGAGTGCSAPVGSAPLEGGEVTL